MLDRKSGSVGMPRPPPAIATLSLHSAVRSWQAEWAAEAVTVTVTEFQLLLLLASMPSRAFTRDARSEERVSRDAETPPGDRHSVSTQRGPIVAGGMGGGGGDGDRHGIPAPPAPCQHAFAGVHARC